MPCGTARAGNAFEANVHSLEAQSRRGGRHWVASTRQAGISLALTHSGAAGTLAGLLACRDRGWGAGPAIDATWLAAMRSMAVHEGRHKAFSTNA